MLSPNEYPRRILVAVTGMSPQIVTETLYGLTVASPCPFVPTEIHLITTSVGAEKARLALLSDDPGWFHRLCKDYTLPPIRFDTNTIHTLTDAAGNPLDDIRSPEDNRQAADGITDLIREFTADPQSALHVSIAGGRKTMGFFLGYALSLYGRNQDKLSHVLISDPFESSIDFYYPTPDSRVLKLRDGRQADTSKAIVTLAELPFVSLRHGLPEDLLTGHASYNKTVEAARRALGPAALHIDLDARRIRAASKVFPLPPAELALLSVFARRAINSEPPLPAPPKETPELGKETQHKKLAAQMRLAHYLKGYGFQLNEGIARPSAERRHNELLQTLIGQIGSLEAPLGQLNFLAQEAEANKRLTINLSAQQQDSRNLVALLRNFELAGVLGVENGTIRFTSEQDRSFTNGGWLEHHVYQTISNLHGELGLRDKAANLVVVDQSEVKNELDVAFLARNRLFIVECKTARMDSARASKANDTLFKLSEICRCVGGLGARGMLASYHPLGDSERRLANALGIEVVVSGELTRLAERLKHWVNG